MNELLSIGTVTKILAKIRGWQTWQPQRPPIAPLRPCHYILSFPAPVLRWNHYSEMFHVTHLLSSQERIHADLFHSLSRWTQKDQKFCMSRG
jgi:hypothetical protein